MIIIQLIYIIRLIIEGVMIWSYYNNKSTQFTKIYNMTLLYSMW